MSADGRQVIDLYHQLVGDHLRQTPFDASSKPAFHAWQRKARRILRGILGEIPDEKIDFQLTRRTVEEHPQYLVEECTSFRNKNVDCS